MHFRGRNIHLCHEFLAVIYQCCPSPHDRPITSKSQLKVDFPNFTSSPSYSSYGCLYFRNDGKVKDGWCLVAFLSLFFLFQLETQGAPSISRYRNFVSFVVFVLSCLLDQSFHFCFKQTDKRKVAASFQLLIYKQTRRLFFNRKLYMEHFNYALFLFFWFCFIVSPTLPPSWIFLQEEEDSSETVLISTRHHRHCNKTLEFRKTWRTHKHLYTYNICVTIYKGPFSSLSLNFLPVQPLIINQYNTELFRGTGKTLTQVHWQIVWSFSGSAL